MAQNKSYYCTALHQWHQFLISMGGGEGRGILDAAGVEWSDEWGEGNPFPS